MRHGESLANKRGLIVSQAHNALNDYGLTTTGTQQVLNAALSARLNESTMIVSSDFKRCKETAEIMHSILACDQDITYLASLRERDFGNYELKDVANYQTVWQHDLHTPDEHIEGVERIDLTLDRSLNTLHEIESRYSDLNVLLVSHGDVLQILLAYFQSLHPRFHRSIASIGNADIRVLNKTKQAQDPHTALSDVDYTHLDQSHPNAA